jgi:hypothetical protein
VALYSQDAGLEIKLVNVYGPYNDRPSLWDSFFGKNWMYDGNTIIGGDLNFYAGKSEIWSPTTHVDPLSSYFLRN